MSFRNQIDKFFSKIGKSWLFRKITDEWIFGEVIAIGAIAIVLYAINFHGQWFSPKTEDWAYFATYLSGTVGVAAVVASLTVLVRTLVEQRELLNLERDKAREVVEHKAKSQRYTAIYLIHRFERMKNFYEKADLALGNKNPETWKAIASKHIAFYDDFLMNEQGELIPFLEKMDSSMALNCIGAVDFYREAFAVIKSTLTDEAIQEDSDTEARAQIKKLNEQRRIETHDLVKKGAAYCAEFLVEANKLLEEERCR